MEENQSPVPIPNLTVACDIPIPGVPSAAECMFKKLMAHIADFERGLNKDQEVGASMVSFGDKPFYIGGIGYHGNDMIIFYGTSTKGQPIKLMQHVTQTNVMLTIMVRRKGHKVPKRIGFRSEDLARLGEEKSSMDPSQSEAP
ncbi:MAG: DUF6173 family protein [Nitrospinae bacterium]|nr:DUF6173 family protein [Nitrospinota bacterium]